MNLTKEQKQIGKDNFNDVVGHINHSDPNRRDFLKGAITGGVGLGAAYFGYQKLQGDRVKVAFIGTGDEGSVLLNEHPVDYMEITAIADMRPSNRARSKTGDSNDVRRGLNQILGKETASKIKEYGTHKELLKARADGEVEFDAVVIAVPLIQHAPVAIDCMNEGLHVLTEKLMARTISQCKEMIKTAKDKRLLLTVGHQRHYNVLYDNANDLVQRGMLGTIKHIRAQWHRNNSFYHKDSWQKQTGKTQPAFESDMKALSPDLIKEMGYPDFEHLANWRLYKNTGGGLMAELGSHQLDAASIFLGKVHPISVTGFGGKNFYGVGWDFNEKGEPTAGVGPSDKWTDQREIDDHVYVIFEFPGPNYKQNPDDIVIVTYSSISTNSFEPYGELVYGSRGTLIMAQELETMLYKEGSGYSTRLTVEESKDEKGNTKRSVVETSDSVGPSSQVAITANASGQKVSRGYKEEMEHFCYAIKNLDKFIDGEGNMTAPKDGGLRCPGTQGMADAIMALTANIAMEKRERIEFQDEWFDPTNPAVPDGSPAGNVKA